MPHWILPYSLPVSFQNDDTPFCSYNILKLRFSFFIRFPNIFQFIWSIFHDFTSATLKPCSCCTAKAILVGTVITVLESGECSMQFVDESISILSCLKRVRHSPILQGRSYRWDIREGLQGICFNKENYFTQQCDALRRKIGIPLIQMITCMNLANHLHGQEHVQIV